MFNYENAQKSFKQAREQAIDFTNAMIDGTYLLTESAAKEFNKITGQTFTTYTDKVLDSFKVVNDNVKKAVKIEPASYFGHSK